VLTCTGVSFAHGSNDGQKGMGLIMLILIGTVPMAYALNHAVTPAQTMDFVAVAEQAANVVHGYVSPSAVIGARAPRLPISSARANSPLPPCWPCSRRSAIWATKRPFTNSSRTCRNK
jgi:phosphate/sulfate permease